MKNVFRRIAIVPFEIAIAILAFVSGLTGLFHIGIVDPIGQLLPAWEADLLNSALLLCGGFLIVGVCLASASIEAIGLWLLNTTIVARFILYGKFFNYGTAFVLTGIFDLAIIAAGSIRLRSIRTKHVLLKVKESNGYGNSEQ